MTSDYCWVINDTTPMIRYICSEANVRYEIGPHQDGDKYAKGMYVHCDDLLKLAKWFISTGQLAEADWTRDARAKYVRGNK